MARRRDEVEEAIEVFVRAFSAGRSQIYPYQCQRVDGLWAMRDAARKNPRDYRREEWVAYGDAACEVDRIIRAHTRGRFAVSAFRGPQQSDDEVKADYKSLGYRLFSTEPFFVHCLKRIPRTVAPAKIVRVASADLAARLGQATRARPIPPECFDDLGPFRQYVALDGEKIVGWVRSVPVGRSSWCSHMEVIPSHRRRGIGKALLAKMLRDDRARGIERSILLASHSGALLYPQVGYEQIGLLYFFTPKKR